MAPIINDHWNRATFPFELLPALRELGTVGTPYTGYNCPGRSFLLDGFAGAVDPLVNCRLLRFQPPLSWYTVSVCTPAGRVTCVVTVDQFCQPPVDGRLTLPLRPHHPGRESSRARPSAPLVSIPGVLSVVPLGLHSPLVFRPRLPGQRLHGQFRRRPYSGTSDVGLPR